MVNDTTKKMGPMYEVEDRAHLQWFFPILGDFSRFWTSLRSVLASKWEAFSWVICVLLICDSFLAGSERNLCHIGNPNLIGHFNVGTINPGLNDACRRRQQNKSYHLPTNFLAFPFCCKTPIIKGLIFVPLKRFREKWLHIFHLLSYTKEGLVFPKWNCLWTVCLCQ